MTYVIPAGFSRLSFQYAPASPIGSAVTWGIGTSSSPSEAILAEIMSWYDDEFQPNQNEAYVLERAEMRSDTLVEEFITSQKGEVTTPHPPPNVACLISLSSGLPGRSNRGRMYWPGVLPEANTDANGIIDPSILVSLQARVNSFMAMLTALSASPVILHSNSSDSTPVTGWTVRQNVATQRRRQRA